MVKRVLAVGLEFTGEPIEGVEIETLGLCRSAIEPDLSAFSLYEYDTIIINPQTYSQFIFGKPGKDAGQEHELFAMKRRKETHDLDTIFDWMDRSNELEAAIAEGVTVVWCLSPPKRQNFFGFRTTHTGFLSSALEKAVERGRMIEKKGRKLSLNDPDAPFFRYFQAVQKDGWSMCLTQDAEGIHPFAKTPEGYAVGARVELENANGWLLAPPTSEAATNQLIRDAIAIKKGTAVAEKYHSIFLSHTGDDKPFVRKLRDDLMARGVQKVWLDEAEILVGDSLTNKIADGIKLSKYIAVILSKKSVGAPWVKKELDIAINREIANGEVAVLPFLFEKCDMPDFLVGKLYADFTDPKSYEDALEKVLRRLRIS